MDSEAEYADRDGSSVVASCDIFDFAGGRLSRITSYTIELGSSATPTSALDTNGMHSHRE